MSIFPTGEQTEIGENSPFETAATVFGIFTPRIEALLKDLSTGELRRLVNAMIQYPLNEKEFVENGSDKLKECFKLANECVRARSIMEFETVLKIQEEKMKQENKEEIKGDTNG